MKQIMRYLGLVSLVILGAMTAGCNSLIDDQQSANNGTVTLTASVNIESNSTKALTDGGVKTFAVDDQVAVVYKKKSDGSTAVAISEKLISDNIKREGKSAQFTVTLEDPDKGEDVTYIYPAAMATADGQVKSSALESQDGTLAALSGSLDCCTKSGAWSGDVLPTLTLVNQFTIGKFTLQDHAGSSSLTTITKVTITDGTNTYTIQKEPVAALSWPIYVAMSPIDNKTVTVTATDSDTHLSYAREVIGQTLESSTMYSVNVKMIRTVDLSKVTSDFTADDGDILTGTLSGNHKISIAAGATDTLNNVIINGGDGDANDYAGINCPGDAHLVLEGTNQVKGFGDKTPGVYIADGYTLTLSGTGSLEAVSGGSSYKDGAGIGGAQGKSCGNIVIESGTITATGGSLCAGIGSGSGGVSCGTITISGGTITATKGSGSIDCVGRGKNGSCSTVTIDGTVYWDGSSYQANGSTYLTTNPMKYPIVKVTSLTLNKTETTIIKGETEQLSVTGVLPANATDKSVTWTSDNEGVATVNASGKVTANSAGYAHIYATANDGSGVVYATCDVTVIQGFTVIGMIIMIYYVPGETWEDAINNHSINDNQGWGIDNGYVYYMYMDIDYLYYKDSGQRVSANEVIDPTKEYMAGD